MRNWLTLSARPQADNFLMKILTQIVCQNLKKKKEFWTKFSRKKELKGISIPLKEKKEFGLPKNEKEEKKELKGTARGLRLLFVKSALLFKKIMHMGSNKETKSPTWKKQENCY